MITKEITLCGKQVTVAYNYATEIAYKNMSDEDIFDYVNQTIEAIQQGKDPDAEKSMKFIYSAMISYSEKQKQEVPIEMEELMNDITPTEFATAILTIIDMRSDFYHVPAGEPEDKNPKGNRVSRTRKNV
jgi:hypothetical protein